VGGVGGGGWCGAAAGPVWQHICVCSQGPRVVPEPCCSSALAMGMGWSWTKDSTATLSPVAAPAPMCTASLERHQATSVRSWMRRMRCLGEPKPVTLSTSAAVLSVDTSGGMRAQLLQRVLTLSPTGLPSREYEPCVLRVFAGVVGS
jgi:hypothetical protein